jgi:hypothetical protein
MDPTRGVLVSTIIHRVVESVYGSLLGVLSDQNKQTSDTDRKRALYNHFESSRSQLVRVLVLARWARGFHSVLCAQEIAARVDAHDRALTETADRLYYLSQ